MKIPSTAFEARCGWSSAARCASRSGQLSQSAYWSWPQDGQRREHSSEAPCPSAAAGSGAPSLPFTVSVSSEGTPSHRR